MKNKGFILVASCHPNDQDHLKETALHVEDLLCDPVAPDDETTSVVTIWIEGLNCNLEFTRNEAKDFIETLQTIVDRYEITPEEWEARHS